MHHCRHHYRRRRLHHYRRRHLHHYRRRFLHHYRRLHLFTQRTTVSRLPAITFSFYLGYKRKKQDDILDWLQVTFGFQKDNAANQREHLILLLANVHIRQISTPDQQPKLDERALNEVMKKLLKNFKKWCKHLDRKSNIWLPIVEGFNSVS